MKISILLLIIFALHIYMHEYGHYVVALKHGIYKGWGIKYGSPYIDVGDNKAPKILCLNGFIFSIPIIPFYMVLGYPLWSILLIKICLSSMDFLAVILHSKMDDKGVITVPEKICRIIDKIKGYCYTVITFPVALFASIAFSLLCLLGELDEKRRMRVREYEKNKSCNSNI